MLFRRQLKWLSQTARVDFLCNGSSCISNVILNWNLILNLGVLSIKGGDFV
jgi:hypothetical protein